MQRRGWRRLIQDPWEIDQVSAGGNFSNSFGQQAVVVSQRNGIWGKAEEVHGTAGVNTGGRSEISSVSCGRWERRPGPRSWTYKEHCDSSGAGHTYKVAASIGNFSIEAETDHAKITTQCVDFGNAGPRNPDVLNGKKDSYHWLWGSNKKIPDHPKTFYSY